jgi:MinD-like ATPase involved in chromosome partitioning or flagellar assembly/tetratricopeptide (TPR) repeat protein
MKTFWTTFYSYKGGVGRSLALANVAALLVKNGHRVVLLDFDLEAPGLDTFTEFKEAKEKAGIVEYVAEFQRCKVAPTLDSFVHAIKLPEALRGKLWIMPSGRKDKAYNHLLARTQWAELFEDGLGAPFIENWKLSIEQAFQPDYVLIDSRTGLTEIGGVCTTAFPDLVVMLFGLNEQNVEGTATVARHIRGAALERQPQLHFVATPIPNFPAEKKGLLQLRFEAAEKTLGVELKSSSIRYWAPASLTESLFALNDSFGSQPMVQDHTRLCKRITEYNRNGLDFLTEQAEDAIDEDNSELAERLSEVLLKNFPDRAEAAFLRSRLARLDGRSGDTHELAERAFELDPTYAPPFQFLCSYYFRVKHPEKVESLCESVLNLGSRLSSSRRSDVLTTLGELRMTVGKYQEAADNYEEVRKLSALDEDGEGLPISQIVTTFNAAESSRRAGRSVLPETWQTIVSSFENFPVLGGLPQMAANRCQAIHIAYAILGNILVAKECLRKAIKAAETVNDLETLFSVRDYRFVNRDEFKATTEEMLAALERGQLWDGTKLQIAQERE